MEGIDLNREIRYLHASLRYFAPLESHVSRVCECNVLLLVFEGNLHFTEDGVCYNIGAGEYFIQKKGTPQGALHPSDSPKYLYVHFEGIWETGGEILPRRGSFSPAELMPLMERLDRSHAQGRSLTEKSALFLRILSKLYQREEPAGPGGEIAAYLRKHACEACTLQELSRRFRYSKNQIINLMKRDFGMTPLEYRNLHRMKRAEWLLRVTSTPLSRIAEECGYGEYSQFYKEFSRTYRLSPKQWREENRDL